MKKPYILAINPGSTSTKIALFEGSKLRFDYTLRHSAQQLAAYDSVSDQFEFRKALILEALAKEGYGSTHVDVIVGRGGLVKPIESGIYEVNEALKADLKQSIQGVHASNLGGLIAAELAENYGDGSKAYIADPVVVDEMSNVAHLAGHPAFSRKSIFHALNQKAVSRRYADSINKPYNQLRIIVAHLGGGVSVGAHVNGRVVDVNNALDGEGPFSPERSGTLPAGDLVNLCFSGKYTKAQIKKMISGEGGVLAHLGHSDTKKAVEDAEGGCAKSKLVMDAFSYNVAKAIGAMACVLSGKVDAIILTGGIAYSKLVCSQIMERVSFIAPVEIMAGEDEMKALADNGLLVWQGKIEVKEYK